MKKSNVKRIMAIVLALCMAGSVLTACGDSSDDSSYPSSTSSSAPANHEQVSAGENIADEDIVYEDFDFEDEDFNFEDEEEEIVETYDDTFDHANEMALTAYKITSEYMAEMEIQGMGPSSVLAAISGDIDCTRESEDDFSSRLHDHFKKYGEAAGIVIVFEQVINGEQSYAVQWKSSADSEIIGQYPEAILEGAEGKVIWGEYYENIEYETYEDTIENANAIAELAYNAAAEYIANQQLFGRSKEEVIESIYGSEIDCTQKAEDGLDSFMYKALRKYESAAGVVIVFEYGRNAYVVQWRSSADSSIIGQYPDRIPAGHESEVVWGEHYYR